MEPEALLMTRHESELAAKGQVEARKAFMGVVQLNLVDTGNAEFVFGRYNKRALSEFQLRRLIGNMEKNGVQRYSEKALIPILVSRTVLDMDVDTLPADSALQEKLSLLRLQDTSGKVQLLVPSGQHCYAAVVRMHKTITHKMTKLDAQLELFNPAQHDTSRDQDHFKALKARRSEFEELSHVMPFWGIRLYDLGEPQSQIIRHVRCLFIPHLHVIANAAPLTYSAYSRVVAST